MIITGGRSDIIVQWFSSDYVRSHKEAFRRITVNPGEVLMTLRKGKVEEIVTETQMSISGGLVEKIVNAFKGGDDGMQLVMVDVRPKQLSLPFLCYSKDRAKIKGAVNMVIRFSAPDVMRAMNLLTEPLLTNAKWPAEDVGKIKEVTLEDLTDIIGHGTNVDIDCHVVSRYDSSEIGDNRIKVSEEVTRIVNNMTPHWSNYGIRVEHIQTEVSENQYEDVMREAALMKKKHLLDDIKYSDDAKQLDLKKNLEKLVIQNGGELEVAKVVADYDTAKATMAGNIELEDMERNAKMKAESELLAHDIDKGITEAEGKKRIRQLEIEIAKSNDDYSVEALVKKAAAEAEAYKKTKDAEVYGMDKEQDVKLKALNEMASIDMKLGAAEAQNEISKREAEARLEETRKTIEYQISIAAKDAYTEGYKEGFETAQRSALQFNESQARNLAAANNASYVSMASGCPKCNDSIRAGMTFCSGCGKRL
jgi:hypothetical protein